MKRFIQVIGFITLALGSQEGIPKYKLTAQNSPSVINPWNRSNGVFQQDHLIQHDRKIIKLFDSSPDLVSVHPSAQYCPGLLPVNAPRVSVSISIDGNYEGRDGSYLYSTPKASIWRGTGLYASAGEKIYVKVPKSIVKMGANIQIGSHIDSDHAYNMESIRRFPYITDSWSIDQTTMEMTSAFGGLVYITIPSGSKLGNFNITIRGAGRAPRYIHGETTQDEWRSIVRKYPAPWAELESDMVILTIPSSEIRDLDDPGRVMDFWKRAMDGANYLAARKTHTRPERYVVDPNWDWGAHAGYPMMIAGPWSQYLIDIDNIGLNFWWGTFHELGHNFQLSEWTWDGWIEVSCNLWATYILETIAGVKREETWDDGNLMPERRKKRIEMYLKYGSGRDSKPNLQDFNGKLLKDPALGLEVLLLLQESFGWDFYKKINGEYLSISKDQEPKSDNGDDRFRQDMRQEKIQDFIFVSSKIAGVNLIDYYRDWGFPIDPKTERALTRLPNWAENPLKQYIHPLSLNWSRVEISQFKDYSNPSAKEFGGFYYMTNILFNDQPVFKNHHGKYLFFQISSYKSNVRRVWVLHHTEPKGFDLNPWDVISYQNEYLLQFYDELKDEWKRKLIKEGEKELDYYYEYKKGAFRPPPK